MTTLNKYKDAIKEEAIKEFLTQSFTAEELGNMFYEKLTEDEKNHFFIEFQEEYEREKIANSRC